MIGTWLGYYKFDSPRAQKIRSHDQTNFTLTVHTFDGRNFKGAVKDDVNSGGMKETGQIIGEVDGMNISFRKLMPVRVFIYPDGERKSENKKHPTLYYTGTFSDDKKEVKGLWKFKLHLVFIFGFIPIIYRPGKGTWSMTLQ